MGVEYMAKRRWAFSCAMQASDTTGEVNRVGLKAESWCMTRAKRRMVCSTATGDRKQTVVDRWWRRTELVYSVMSEMYFSMKSSFTGALECQVFNG